VAVAVAGVLLITLWNWLVDTASAWSPRTPGARAAIGPRGLDVVYRIIVVALWVRVLAGWFGYFRYSRWVRRRMR